MQLEFDRNIIGKFCKKEKDKYSNMLEFRIVVGYDFVNKVYIVKDMHNLFHGYNILCAAGKELPELYTFEQACAIIDEEIEKEKQKYLILDKQLPETRQKEFRSNEATEFARLFNTYKECRNQIGIYQEYLIWAEQRHDFETRNLYTKELAGAQKALRRLDKRFYYYFGDEAKRVQEIVVGYGYFDDVVHAKSRIADLLKRYEKYKDTLKFEASKL